jgi:hypothetical protein
MANWWANYIRRRGRGLGLDPAALLAVAAQEGLSGRAGDQGTSFGPFQMHVGGALPAGRGRAWAESPAGIDYALHQIAAVARGEHGQRAIADIVSRFERPADPRGEIARALAAYGQGAGAASQSFTTPAPNLATSAGPTGDQSARLGLARALIAASQSSSRHERPDYSDVIGKLGALQSSPASAGPAAAPPSMPSSIPGSTKRGELRELFYDPLGALKNGQRIPAIGGHRDHVHIATGSVGSMVAAISHAEQMGMRVGENLLVGPVHRVHVTDSNHYKLLGTYRGHKVSGAADISGTPAQMAAYFRWAAKNL